MKPLYAFYHVRKCAGTTLIKTMQKNLNPSEWIQLNPKGDDLTSLRYRSTAQILDPDGVDVRMRCLSNEEKMNIRFIFGHRTYSDIAQIFKDREVRFITFLRHPVERTLSHYNWVCQKATKQGRSITPFEVWLETTPAISNTMTRSFIQTFKKRDYTGFLDVTDQSLSQAVEILKTFYFVGLTEQMDIDSHYLYYAWNFWKFLPRQKKSGGYLTSLGRGQVRLIEKKCSFDFVLYEQAVEMNARFRKSHKGYCFRSTVSQIGKKLSFQ